MGNETRPLGHVDTRKKGAIHMTLSNIINVRTAVLTTALMIPAASFAQDNTWTYSDLDSDGNLELTESEVSAGMSDAGTFNAWDRDDEVGLNEGEFATGMFSSWDTDNDLQITEQEYQTGTERWCGPDYEPAFSNYDADTSGYIDRNEFGTSWDNEYYTQWDQDSE